jgi:3-oxoacyl-[acyl-carrier protein] reductase
MQRKYVDLSGQIALVTGASRGIGRSVALELAAQGATIALNYAKNEEAARKVAEEIGALGGVCELYQADVTDLAAVSRIVKQIVARFGRVDILVNNAGILARSFLMLMSKEEFSTVLNTNVAGPFHCIKAVCPTMIKQRSGTIVNMSSLAGSKGLVGQGAYAASKAALESLTRISSKELASYGVRVNAVAPGCIQTGMMNTLDEAVQQQYLQQIPLKRYGESEEVAKCVTFLASSLSSYITGQTIIVDGGMGIN